MWLVLMWSICETERKENCSMASFSLKMFHRVHVEENQTISGNVRDCLWLWNVCEKRETEEQYEKLGGIGKVWSPEDSRRGITSGPGLWGTVVAPHHAGLIRARDEGLAKVLRWQAPYETQPRYFTPPLFCLPLLHARRGNRCKQSGKKTDSKKIQCTKLYCTSNVCGIRYHTIYLKYSKTR